MGGLKTTTVGFVTLSALIWGGWVVGSQTNEGVEALGSLYTDLKEFKVQQHEQEFFGDGALRVMVCGEGDMFNNDGGSSKPCLAVAAGGKLFIIDAGSGAARALERVMLPLNRLHAILLTGGDPVRSGDLDELFSLASAARGYAKLPVYGPAEVHRVVMGINQQIGAVEGVNGLERLAPVPEPGRPVIVYKDDALEILAYTTEQDAMNSLVGYHISYRGRAVTVTPNGSAAWAAAAPGHTDVLLQSTMAEPITDLHRPDTTDAFASLQQFAEVAKDANTSALVLANVGENATLAAASRRVAQEAGMENVVTGAKGMVLELPLENRELNVRTF